MKLLIFTPAFYPHIGGLENYVLELSTRLAKKGIKTDICTFNIQNNKTFEEYKGLRIYRLQCRVILGGTYFIPKFNSSTRKIFSYLSKQKYDFVITNTRFFLSSWLGMRFAKKNKIKHIHIEHGNVFVKHSNKLVQFIAWLYDMTLGKKVIKSAYRTIGISSACCKFAEKMGAKRCDVIPNSVNTNVFKKTKTSLKIGKNSKIITFVGRLIYAKGIQDLIKACSKLDGIKLLIVGDGHYMADLKRISKQCKVDALFLGKKNSKEVNEILNISDVFVNPSYSEGLPTCVLEAGAVGVPVIATDVGGTREIIEDGVNGFLVEPRNAKQIKERVARLLSDKSLSRKFSKNIRKTIENKFDWNKNADKFLEMLKRC